MKSQTKDFPNIAIIGSGYWGKNLVRNYAQLNVLQLVCDSNESTLSAIKNDYPEIDTCFAIKDVLSREDIQGIVISSPAETHFRIAQEALLSGKHVFVEKPITLKIHEAQTLIELSKKYSLTLMVGHLLQYHPVFDHLKKLVKSGELGRINYIYSNRLNLGKIRREENILWSFAPHDISMILSLTDEEPTSVFAIGENYLHKKIADVTTTHLSFSSGVRAHIFVSWLHPFKEQKLVVVGDKKMAVFDDTLSWQEKLLVYPHQIQWSNNTPIPDKALPQKIFVKQSEPLKMECKHFLECIQTGKTPKTDGNEGLRVLKVLNSSQKSLDNKKTMYISSDISSKKSYFAHDSAIIDDNVTIGDGTKIWHFSHILSKTMIGKNCIISQNAMVGPDVVIGNTCKIQNNVSVFKGVILEDDVFCGPSMVFTNVNNPRAHIQKMDQLLPTLVKKGATIGANATIICGVTSR
jgi:predicted dehydrogenase/acetyltransferase-like isoleucine patch superfamily enzyme